MRNAPNWDSQIEKFEKSFIVTIKQKSLKFFIVTQKRKSLNFLYFIQRPGTDNKQN